MKARKPGKANSAIPSRDRGSSPASFSHASSFQYSSSASSLRKRRRSGGSAGAGGTTSERFSTRSIRALRCARYRRASASRGRLVGSLMVLVRAARYAAS
nr:MAG: hypothetical protein DIU52_09325 [bacterium]